MAVGTTFGKLWKMALLRDVDTLYPFQRRAVCTTGRWHQWALSCCRRAVGELKVLDNSIDFFLSPVARAGAASQA